MLKYEKFHVTSLFLILFIIALQSFECNSYTHNGIPKLLNLVHNGNGMNGGDSAKMDVKDLQVGNEMEIFSPKLEYMKTGLLSHDSEYDWNGKDNHLLKLTQATCAPKCEPCEPECEDRPIRLEIKSFKTVKPEAITGQRCVQFKECCCQNVPCKTQKCVSSQRKCVRRCY